MFSDPLCKLAIIRWNYWSNKCHPHANEMVVGKRRKKRGLSSKKELNSTEMLLASSCCAPVILVKGRDNLKIFREQGLQLINETQARRDLFPMVEEITPNPCALEVLQPRAFAASASTAQSDIAQINEHICVPHIMPVHLFSHIYLKILPGCTTLASDPCQHRTCCLILKHFLEINTLHQLHKGFISVKGPALTS